MKWLSRKGRKRRGDGDRPTRDQSILAEKEKREMNEALARLEELERRAQLWALRRGGRWKHS